MKSETKVLVIVFVSFAALFIFLKFIAPQSSWRTRMGGKPVTLEIPKDLDKNRPITLGKTENTKWICYYDKRGNLHLREYTDWAILEGEYVLKIGEKKK